MNEETQEVSQQEPVVNSYEEEARAQGWVAHDEFCGK